jgi:hypothetical protein
MLAAKTLSIVAILFLLSPLVCPLMAAQETEDSAHSCSGEQQKQKEQAMHSCCDQQAIQAKAFELKDWNASQMLPLAESELTARMSIVVPGLQDRSHLHRKTGDLLAKLSVLRI